MSLFEAIRGNDLTYRLGWTLVHSLWLGLILSGLLAVTMLVLRRWPARALPCRLRGHGGVARGGSGYVLHGPSPSKGAAYPGGRVLLQCSQDNGTHSSAAEAKGRTLSPGSAALASGCDVLEPIIPWACLGWMAGIFLMSLRHLYGWTGIVRIRRNACIV